MAMTACLPPLQGAILASHLPGTGLVKHTRSLATFWYAFDMELDWRAEEAEGGSGCLACLVRKQSGAMNPGLAYFLDEIREGAQASTGRMPVAPTGETPVSPKTVSAGCFDAGGITAISRMVEGA